MQVGGKNQSYYSKDAWWEVCRASSKFDLASCLEFAKELTQQGKGKMGAFVKSKKITKKL